MTTSIQYYVYILANERHTVFYIGITSDLQSRIFKHVNKIYEGFTKDYNVTKLMYYEIHGDVNEAIKREKVLKKWKREWKWNLIDKYNPERKNLYINGDIIALKFE